MDYAYHILDVFTDTPFTGNPLAVFPRAQGMSDAQMQTVARELNLSETVFLLPPETPRGTARVRIFTPGREVPFAGHPTIGAALFLGRAKGLEGERVLVLEEGVGPVSVRIWTKAGQPARAELVAAQSPVEWPVADTLAPGARGDLARMVGLSPDRIGMDGGVLGAPRPLEPAFASVGLAFLILPVRDRASAEAALLDSAVWARVLPEGAPSRMVYLVAPCERDGAGGEAVDLHVRMFGPDVGVPEDPATGSAAAALGGYLGSRLPDGVHRWHIEQGVEMGRPSRIRLTVEVGDGQATEVRVAGGAVEVARGTMTVG